jgi:hypothetical protein
MMSSCCSKHVKAWNKYIEKECVKLVINQIYVEMRGQQNIVFVRLFTHILVYVYILCFNYRFWTAIYMSLLKLL